LYGHHGKHLTFIQFLEEGEGYCRLRLENCRKNAVQISDMGRSRKQYNAVKSLLQRE
jgi:hypothetical protein